MVIITDYSAPNNQIDKSKEIKKYQRRLKPEPTEKQKFNEYLTYQQPILDELNYNTEKKRQKKEQRKEEDFIRTEELKDKREEQLKKKALMGKTPEIKQRLQEDLFDVKPVINKDPNPTINTNIDLIDFTETPQRQEEIKQEEAIIKIEKGIIDKIKRNRAKKEMEQQKTINNINKIISASDYDNQLLINKAFEKASDEVKKDQAAARIQGVIKKNIIQPLYEKGKELFELKKGEPEREVPKPKGRPKLTEEEKAAKKEEKRKAKEEIKALEAMAAEIEATPARGKKKGKGKK